MLPFAIEFAKYVKDLISLTEYKQHTTEKKYTVLLPLLKYVPPTVKALVPHSLESMLWVLLFCICSLVAIIAFHLLHGKGCVAQGAGILVGKMYNLENQTSLFTSFVMLAKLLSLYKPKLAFLPVNKLLLTFLTWLF